MIKRNDIYDMIVEARQDMSDSMNEAFCNGSAYDQQYYYGADKMFRDMLWAIEETETQEFSKKELEEMVLKERETLFDDCSLVAMCDGVSMAEDMLYIWCEVLEEV